MQQYAPFDNSHSWFHHSSVWSSCSLCKSPVLSAVAHSVKLASEGLVCQTFRSETIVGLDFRLAAGVCPSFRLEPPGLCANRAVVLLLCSTLAGVMHRTYLLWRLHRYDNQPSAAFRLLLQGQFQHHLLHPKATHLKDRARAPTLWPFSS
jgi:hypothetical protein